MTPLVQLGLSVHKQHPDQLEWPCLWEQFVNRKAIPFDKLENALCLNYSHCTHHNEQDERLKGLQSLLLRIKYCLDSNLLEIHHRCSPALKIEKKIKILFAKAAH
jgi:hypothetical protein